MSGLLKVVLFIIAFYYLYKWLTSSLKGKTNHTRDDKDIKIFKTKELEDSKYNIEAETVEFEEIEEDEPK